MMVTATMEVGEGGAYILIVNKFIDYLHVCIRNCDRICNCSYLFFNIKVFRIDLNGIFCVCALAVTEPTDDIINSI